MARSRSSVTANAAALCRAIEQYEPPGQRLFNDPIVGRLLDPMTTVLAGTAPMRAQLLASLPPGAYGGQVLRTRYLDDMVSEAVGGGLTQVVILGAGLDTRAYRLPALARATVFECDMPATQTQKRRGLDGVRPVAHGVRFVAVDLGTQSLAGALANAGFDCGRPAVFVLEGLTQYLDEGAVCSILGYIGEAAPGSVVVFTYVLASLVGVGARAGWSGPLWQQLQASEPWRFGLEPAEVLDLLSGVGLTLIEEVGAAEYRVRYLEPLGRDLLPDPGEHAVLALVGTG